MNAPLKALNFEDPIASQVRVMLEELGEDPRREGLQDTPARYARAMRYLAGGYASDVASVVGGGVRRRRGGRGDGP
jgi:GTP cyclohydrolase IA